MIADKVTTHSLSLIRKIKQVSFQIVLLECGGGNSSGTQYYSVALHQQHSVAQDEHQAKTEVLNQPSSLF